MSDKKHHYNFIDMTGQKFNKLTVIKEVESKSSSRKKVPTWLCQCDCGNTHVTTGMSLRDGKVKSCGCNRLVPGNRKTDREGYLWSVVYNVYRGRNRTKHGMDHMWDLSLENFRYICSQNCFYCNQPPSNEQNDYAKHNPSTLKYSSLDRLDSSKGYFLANVVPCCDDCNTAKASMSVERWISWLNSVKSNFLETEKFKLLLSDPQRDKNKNIETVRIIF